MTPRVQHDDLPCIDLVELVTEYLEGPMTTSERDRFEAHLEACPYCAEYVRQMQALGGSLGALSEGLDADRRNALVEAFRGWQTS